jgi:molybdopterin-guanine dinucleotide biosynthesis protein A
MATKAVILCGGAGERMQGLDKPLHPLLGRPLLEHVLKQLRPQVDALVVVANRQPQAYAAYGIKVVDDGIYKGRGPLAGIAAGLAAADSEWVLCAPGDAPLLPPDLLHRLRAALQSDAADLAVVNDGNGRQPLCCLLPRRLLADLRQYLDGGGDAPRLWQDHFRVAEADCSDWPRWAWSLNTPEEWAVAELQMSQWKDPA